jgi:hypothetical protein
MVSLGSVVVMSTASVTDENRLFLDHMSSLTMGGAWIDCVFVV